MVENRPPDQHAAFQASASSLASPAASPATTELHSIFDRKQKAIIIAIVSIAATFSGFASNIYFPAIPTLTREFSVSTELINLTVTSYLIFQGLAPSLWGPISDVKGRRVAYCFTFIVFCAACIGLALAKNYATVLVLRCLQSTGSASTIAIGSGVIGDITTRDERGSFMGIFQAGLLVPVAVGPVIGGALAGGLGWRSIFWFLAIYSGAFLICLVALLPETLRSIVGNGSQMSKNPLVCYPLNVFQRTTKTEWRQGSQGVRFSSETRVDLTGPVRILLSKKAAPLILFVGVYYTVWQMSITAMSSLLEERYGLGETEIGLTFIANGAGSMIGTLITGKILDWEYRRIKDSHTSRLSNIENSSRGDQNDMATGSEFPLERARLALIPLFSMAQGFAILLFGWTINFSDKVHIAVPIISTFFTGWAAIATQSIVMTYLVDIFPTKSASASASLNLARCLLAAAGTSAVMPMINGVGVGWAFTICCVLQVIALIGPTLQFYYGGQWRKEG